MTRTRPGRSVSQRLPCAAKASAHGAPRFAATVWWLSFNVPGGRMVGAGVGVVAAGRGDGEAAAFPGRAVEPHAASVTTAARAARLLRSAMSTLPPAASAIRRALLSRVLVKKGDSAPPGLVHMGGHDRRPPGHP